MLRFTALIALLFIIFTSKAQHGNNWAFGLFSGIQFTKDGVVKITTKIEVDSSKFNRTPVMRSTSYSDCSGNMAVYGGANQLWNKNNFTLKNGYFPNNASWFYSILLVPKPNSQRFIYYFNHNNHYVGSSGNADSFFFHVIDLNADNGNGSIIKRGFLHHHISNNLTYTMHANGKDIWILNGYDDKTLYAYLLTDTGLITTPIVSSNVFMGQIAYPYLPQWPNPFSYYRTTTSPLSNGNIKVSNNRCKLICTGVDSVTTKDGCVWEYDFNNATGKASNGKAIFKFSEVPKFTLAGNFYSSAISTNDTFYYFATYGENKYLEPKATNSIWQYNTNTGKKTRIYSKRARFIDFQLGPDGKIYFLEWEMPPTPLYRINYPNRAGTDCKIEILLQDSAFFYTQSLPTVYLPYRPLYYSSNLEKGPCKDTAEFILHVDTNFRQISVFYGDGDSVVFNKPLQSVYSVKHYYKATGTYYFRLQALNPVCNSYTYAGDSISIALIPKRVNLKTNVFPQCDQTSVFVQDSFVNVTSAIYQWQNGADTLSFGNNSVINGISKVFSQQFYPGKASWKLRIGNKECPNFLVYNDSAYLQFYPRTKIGFHLEGFSILDTLNSKKHFSGCEPLRLTFTDTTPDLLKGLLHWGISTDSSISHSGNVPLDKTFTKGNYLVTIHNTNSYGCLAIDTFYITSWESPKLSWQGGVMEQCFKGNSFEVTNHSPAIYNSSTPVLYWGDGDSLLLDSGIKAVHRYSKVSSNKIQLKAKSDKGCTSILDTLAIVYDFVNAKFSINNDSQCLKDNQFVLELLDTLAKTNQNSWLLGDSSNTFSFGNQPVFHHYDRVGSYTIRNITSTAFGCFDTSNQKIAVLESPEALIILKDTVECLTDNTFILKTNSISSDLNKVIHTVDWDDQNYSNFAGNDSAKHSYVKSGKYFVKLYCKGENACTDSANKELTVLEPPSIQLLVKGFCLGDTTIIMASSFNPSLYHWQINDSLIVNNKNIFKTVYRFAGTYKAIVSISSFSSECIAVDSTLFNIVEKPTADFEYVHYARDNNGIPFHFINNSIGASTCLWDFNGLDTSTQYSPKYVFTDTGLTKVQLKISKNNVCFDSIEKIIPVLDDIDFFFPNAFSPDNNGLNDGFSLNSNQHYMVNEFHIEIFNRWGEKVFESNNVKEAWNTDAFQQGLYIYKASIRDVYNVLHMINGTVGILR